MAKQCPVCGRMTDDNAKFCAVCGTPLQTPSAPEAPAQPVYEAPAQTAFETPEQPAYQAPAQPAFDTPEQPTYQPPVQPAQPAQRPYPTAQPINQSAGRNYAAPLQQQGYHPQYQPAPEKKNRNLAMGITIAVIIGLLIIGGIVLTIVLVSNATKNNASSSSTGSTTSVSASPLEGTYSLSAIHMDGEDYQESGTLVIGGDNKGTFTDATGSSATFVFDTAKQTLTTSLGATGTYTVSGNTLTITYTPDYSVVFTKQ